MKYSQFSCFFCLFLALMIGDISLVSGADRNSETKNSCNLKFGQGSCQNMDIGIHENERNSCAVSANTQGGTGVERDKYVSGCERIDKRFELLILFLQIMRSAK